MNPDKMLSEAEIDMMERACTSPYNDQRPSILGMKKLCAQAKLAIPKPRQDADCLPCYEHGHEKCVCKPRQDAGRVRDEVWAFALLMESRLRRNDSRGGWKSCTREYLWERLDANMKDLYESWLRPEQDMNETLGALVDIGNFAMMLADTEPNQNKALAALSTRSVAQSPEKK